ncbi:RidA family protein [Ferrovibrio sp.]|uniref:RidA family protein n=1 Tax=Ferrovibrio sp. TaxID=1917215 RepID=UPI0025C2C70F|nr:RidA family protein [Ferrovibrio sp.]MBX3456142.1 RidA family protein [Ferrovibrio sp.]
MQRKLNPPEAMAPAGPYSQAIEVQAEARLLYISGQVGVDATGRTGIGILEQAQMAWTNIGRILRSTHMEPSDLVKVTIYYAQTVEINHAMRLALGTIRERFMEGARPTSTAMFVHRLMKPEWLIEIEAVAARK